jgi:hypothetical protein
MNKIYYVIIKGRTLESRNLKELLARAVSEKRNLDRVSHLPTRSLSQTPSCNAANPYSEERQTAVF